MRYSELAAPQRLRHAIKLAWTLDVDAGSDETVQHVATPDGCVEVIWRLRGRSHWKGEQPHSFVAGVICKPAELKMSGDGRFIAVRLWPWAWNQIASIPSHRLLDSWAPLDEAAPQLAAPADAPEAMETMAAAIAQVPAEPIHSAIQASRTVAELAQRSGRSHRWLQRWFERNVGLAPRTYLRLLRFSETLEQLAGESSLAGHAASHGFADQAHMSREFRALSGSSARAARDNAVGPFVPASMGPHRGG